MRDRCVAIVAGLCLVQYFSLLSAVECAQAAEVDMSRSAPIWPLFALALSLFCTALSGWALFRPAALDIRHTDVGLGHDAGNTQPR